MYIFQKLALITKCATHDSSCDDFYSEVGVGIEVIHEGKKGHTHMRTCILVGTFHYLMQLINLN